ncbi:MAG: AbrB/MazE/SpoVT family DNA-binding domain-containing protein [Verrucomicrobiota bacterium]
MHFDVGNDSLLDMKEVDVMSVTVKGQALLPKEWRERVGLKHGGAVRVVQLNDPDHSLLLTPLRKPKRTSRGLAKFLRSCPAELPVPERHILPFK